MGFEKNDFIIGYVGRIAREKSLLTLKKAFNKIQGYNNKLLFVGDGINNLKNKLKGNNKNIILTGKVNNVIQYLNAMDVFVMPSLTETTCLAALEAMSCELPVISTKVGSIRNYIKDKKTGLFFSKENETTLALKINYLKATPQKRKALGVNARIMVKENYDYRKTIRSILHLFKMELE